MLREVNKGWESLSESQDLNIIVNLCSVSLGDAFGDPNDVPHLLFL